MIWHIIHIVDIIIWLMVAVSVGYILFYALIAVFHAKRPLAASDIKKDNKFLVLYPAYKEDAVVKGAVQEFIKQEYPQNKYELVVISDQMQDDTNAFLRTLPITVLQPKFEKSSKAKSLQYAVSEIEKQNEQFDFVVILDADNVVQKDFLTNLNKVCNSGYKAIQCHRCAKNSNNDIAVLDGVSEEINNTIFRKGHNNAGLSSALIGSGMCFDYNWFAENVNKLGTAGEDRELEILLIKQGIHIHYEENIPVFDEKVSNADNFQRQRLRWMTAQVQSFLQLLPGTFKALAKGNINYLDKTLQQSLIPRSVLLVLTFLMSVLMSILAFTWAPKWWILFFLTCFTLFISIPPALRRTAVLGKVVKLPALVWRMIKNVRHIDKNNTDFLHTTHEK